MKCPFCNSEDTKVIDSRSFMDGYSIKRRRECIKCEKRFTTFEKVEETPLYVVKKDKRRDKFDRNKLMRGLVAATVKRNISRESLETFVLEIEKNIQNSLKAEITTKELGEMVMEKLKKIDQVAYVRFASVYKEFKDIKSFIEIVEDINKDNNKEKNLLFGRIPYTHQEIAESLAISRVTVTKVLNQFKEEGLIDIQYGHIQVLERQKLYNHYLAKLD